MPQLVVSNYQNIIVENGNSYFTVNCAIPASVEFHAINFTFLSAVACSLKLESKPLLT